MARVNGVISDVLRSFAGVRAYDWQALVPLVESEINNSAWGQATRSSTPTVACIPAAP